jgi:cryptochrome
MDISVIYYSDNQSLESLIDLDLKLQSLDSRLILIRGNPQDVFPELLKKWNVSGLYYEKETEPDAVDRDQRISAICQQMEVTVNCTVGHTLFASEDVIKANKGKPPLSLTSFLKVSHTSYEKCIQNLKVPDCLEAPTRLPKIGPLNELNIKSSTSYDAPKLTSDLIDVQKRTEFFKFYNGPKRDFSIPDISELGYEVLSKDNQSPHKGGETNALKLLSDYFKNFNVAGFEKPNTSPAQFEPASTTVLSPHLKFGTLSCRYFYQRLQEVYQQKKNHSHPPVSLLGQLYWREFFTVTSSAIPNFDKMKGNQICLQIPWKLQDSADLGPEEDKAQLRAWTEARTGYPWIDAIMTQLRTEGWIHHLARHSVACFLTRGDLYISWERGRDVFDELLLDSDYALNNANWMWLSASAFFTQYFRVYSPVAFGKKWDKDGKYIKKYVPALHKMPIQYIFEPWKAPLSVQKQAGCIIGVDYPHPIVEHETISKKNMEKMKAAYARGAKGNAPATNHPQSEYDDVVHEVIKPSKKRSTDNIQNFFNKRTK